MLYDMLVPIYGNRMDAATLYSVRQNLLKEKYRKNYSQSGNGELLCRFFVALHFLFFGSRFCTDSDAVTEQCPHPIFHGMSYNWSYSVLSACVGSRGLLCTCVRRHSTEQIKDHFSVFMRRREMMSGDWGPYLFTTWTTAHSAARESLVSRSSQIENDLR